MRPRYRSHMRDNIRYHLTLLMESHTGSLPGASVTTIYVNNNHYQLFFFMPLKHSVFADSLRANQGVEQSA